MNIARKLYIEDYRKQALTICSECSNTINDYTSVCPMCGRVFVSSDYYFEQYYGE